MTSTAAEFSEQSTNPSDVFSVLLILGGDMIARALAQLAGFAVTPVAFSFGELLGRFLKGSLSNGYVGLLLAQGADLYVYHESRLSRLRRNRHSVRCWREQNHAPPRL